MLPNREGQRVPEVTFHVLGEGGWAHPSTADVFAGKNVVVFALPGAFTPTCSTAHVPRYQELLPAFRARGIDEVVCVSVNDTFVMNAWQADQNADGVRFLPDGNGDFSRAMGMLVDKHELGFGPRSWRYSMLVRDGTVEKQFVEPEVEGDPYEVSDADTMLAYLAGEGEIHHDVLLFTKRGCSHCARAKGALGERGLEFREVQSTPGMLRAVAGRPTTPQVFVDGAHLGGADELVAWLADH